MFEAICKTDRVAASFLKILMGLGRKRSSTDEDFMACYTQFSTSRKGDGPDEREHRGEDADVISSSLPSIPFINIPRLLTSI
jgi:hypothetical protein